MSEVKIAARPRTEFGKGAARRTRRAGDVPAVIYGHGDAPKHVSVPAYDLMLALRAPNVLLRLNIEGDGSALVIPKEVQREPLRGSLTHVDLLAVRSGEKVSVEIPVHTEGELAPGGNLLEHILNALPVEAEATHIPQSVSVSVEGLEAGASVLAKNIVLPRGVSLGVDEDTVVLQVVAAQVEAQPEGEEGAGEA
jgi:large subunit ribosomal protein L25